MIIYKVFDLSTTYLKVMTKNELLHVKECVGFAFDEGENCRPMVDDFIMDDKVVLSIL